VVEPVALRSLGRRALDLPPDPHVERKHNRHDHHSTDSQDEKPPEHPHNAIKDSRWAPTRMGTGSQKNHPPTTSGRKTLAARRSGFLRRFGQRFATLLNILRDALQALASELRSGDYFLDVAEGIRIVGLLAKFLEEGMNLGEN